MARRKILRSRLSASAWMDAVLGGDSEVDLVHAGHPLYSEPFAYDLRRTIPYHLVYLVLGGACRFTFKHATVRVDPVSLVWVMPGVSYEPANVGEKGCSLSSPATVSHQAVVFKLSLYCVVEKFSTYVAKPARGASVQKTSAAIAPIAALSERNLMITSPRVLAASGSLQ